MALQTEQFLRCSVATSPHDLRYRNLAIVVADSVGNPLKELEGPLVSFLKGLGTLTRERLTKEGVTVRKGHHEEGGLPLSATVKDLRLTEVELGFARLVGERQEHFLLLLLPRAHCVLDDRDLARVACFITKSIKNPLRRMTLLLGGLLVRLQHRMKDRQVGGDDRLRPFSSPPLFGGLRVNQDLLKCLPVEGVLLARLSF